MKILVLSDSHGGRSFMRECVRFVQPNAVVHLGDYYSDAEDLQEEFPQLYVYMVPGNCDAHRGWIRDPETRVEKVCGVKLYMTHGHRERVKQGTGGLTAEARRYGAQMALYGHTHRMDCRREADGLWVLNPGPATHSAGLIKTDGQALIACYILTETDLEDWV